MNLSEITNILVRISFAPSNLDMGWKWEVKESSEGFLIRTTFQRPDTNTGEVGTGFGRWMHVDKNTDERGIIMTAWICAELIVKHELMEAFLVDGVRILDPHKSIEELAYPHKLNK